MSLNMVFISILMDIKITNKKDSNFQMRNLLYNKIKIFLLCMKSKKYNKIFRRVYCNFSTQTTDVIN